MLLCTEFYFQWRTSNIKFYFFMQKLDTILRNDAWSLVRFVSNKKPSSFNNFPFHGPLLNAKRKHNFHFGVIIKCNVLNWILSVWISASSNKLLLHNQHLSKNDQSKKLHKNCFFRILVRLCDYCEAPINSSNLIFKRINSRHTKHKYSTKNKTYAFVFVQ